MHVWRRKRLLSEERDDALHSIRKFAHHGRLLDSKQEKAMNLVGAIFGLN
jgi:hypothetical protein